MRPLAPYLLAVAPLALPAAAQPPEPATEIRLTPSPPAAPALAGGALRARLLELLNAQRAAFGLAPLAAEPALERAAQRHADDMLAKDYFAFVSPTGEDVDRWLGEEGYLAAMVGEKLVQAPPGRTVEELMAGWAAAPEANANSLFHPEARSLGLGVAEREDAVLYVLVFARGAAEAAASALDRALGEAAPARAEFLARVNALRREAGLSPLQGDPALDRPAQEHAEAVLAALRRGDAPESVEKLPDRVQAALAGIGSYRGVDRDTFWQVGKGRIEPKRASLGSSVVLDAPSPAAAVEAALALDAASDLRESGFRRLGVGVAHGEVGGRPRAVWVAVLLRG